MKYAAILLLILVVACDRVKEPIPPGTSGNGSAERVTDWDLENSSLVGYIYQVGSEEIYQVAEKKVLEAGDAAGSGSERKVLLEDFTGHRCNNCPQATATGLSLQEQYGEQVVVVGVHAGPTNFVAPDENAPNNSFRTDFRTEAGNAYAQTYGVNFLPVGMLNRRIIDGSRLQSHNSWPSQVQGMIGLTSPFDLWFSRMEFDPGTNLLHAEIKVAVLQNVDASYKVTVYFVEDHVVDWQINNQATPPEVSNYDHRHVLRANLNDTWGTLVINGSAAAGDTLTLALPNFQL